MASTFLQFSQPEPRTLIVNILDLLKDKTLWATDHPLGPQTAAARWDSIAKAILFIGF
jgi:hypothetical protein